MSGTESMRIRAKKRSRKKSRYELTGWTAAGNERQGLYAGGNDRQMGGQWIKRAISLGLGHEQDEHD